MPKVDPTTNEPMSDAPDQTDDELRGGKTIGDPALEEGTPQGGPASRLSPKSSTPQGGVLPGSKKATGDD